ncbi:hypothetical protein PVAP13_1NG137157 [Panicum virgatum]|uniref:Uncharacterized protein n=1 Tax=Panicum virgatum TaxID=38727 RepID=A0A8T0WTB4_PANVG|nr:hypothetical protein PVAP13_1NG137157 [Panicum virgatum]
MTCKGLYAKCPPFLPVLLPPGANRPTPPGKQRWLACRPRVGLRPRSSAHHDLISSRHRLPFPPPAISALAASPAGRPSPTSPPLGLRAPSPNPPRAQPQPKQRWALPPLPPRLLPRSGAASTLRSAALPAPLLTCAI